MSGESKNEALVEALLELRREFPHMEDELLLPLAEAAAYPLEVF